MITKILMGVGVVVWVLGICFWADYFTTPKK
jgi:hypothetical protein